jgi:iron complex outermembrane receptor protein
MLNFKPNKLTLAILSTGLLAMSSSSFSAETAAEKKAQEEETLEIITVTLIKPG